MNFISKNAHFIFLPLLSALFTISVQSSLYSQEDKKTAINGFMPEKINVKTLTQTFCKDHDFLIYNGRLWSKSTNKSEWSLFLGTGLPFSKTEERLGGREWFDPPKALKEICADGDTVFVFDENGKMFKFLTQFTTVDKPFIWLDTFGWPKKLELIKDEKFLKARAWGIGVRRKDILYYTDSFGNEHHYGTMGLETIYYLTENGQEIRFTDSGLPASFSKTILGPERGAFIAENMSVSGSTLFLINDAGEMYTRLIDYDTMGCDPMFFKYSYNPQKQNLSGTNYRSNYTQWALPNEDWKKQPEIPLKGKAKLSRYISISQNGKGNSARSLRVAGLSNDGSTGYYVKQIDDEKWHFEKAGLSITDTDYLKHANARESLDNRIRSSLRGKKHEFAYSGYVYKNNKKLDSLECTITDFPLTTEGSCNLTIKDKVSGETKSFLLYPLELWTFITQKDPGFDGTSRNYFVTPSFNPEILRSKNNEFGTVLSDIFIGTNLQLYSFSASATTDYVEIYGKDSSEYSIFLTAESLENQLSPEEYKANLIFAHPLIENNISKPELVLDPERTYTVFDTQEIQKTIEENKKVIEQLESDALTFQEYSKNTAKARWGYGFLDILTSLTLLKNVDFPKIKTATMHSNDIFKSNADSFRIMSEYRFFAYPFIIRLIQKRIEVYEDFIHELSKTNSPKINPLLKNTYHEYFDAAKLPQKCSGVSPLLFCKAQMERDETIPIYPAIRLFLEGSSVLVELPDFIDGYFTAAEKSKDFSCTASFKTVFEENEGKYNEVLKQILKKDGTLKITGNQVLILTASGNVLFSSDF